MNKPQPIAAADLLTRPHHLWAAQWLLLTAGDFASGDFNAMTVGWGSLGTMWGKPFAQVVVRPGRHTHGFMERADSFTLCAFPEKYRPAPQLLGKQSDRDGDKITASGLTPPPQRGWPRPAMRKPNCLQGRSCLYLWLRPPRDCPPYAP